MTTSASSPNVDLEQLHRDAVVAESRAKRRTLRVVLLIVASAFGAIVFWSNLLINERKRAEAEAALALQAVQLTRQVAGVEATSSDRDLYVSTAGYLVSTKTGKPISKLADGQINLARFSSDGRRIVIVSGQNITIFNSAGELQNKFVLQNETAQSARFSSDGGHLIVVLTDGSVDIFTPNGQLIGKFAGSKGITNAIFSPDDRQILTEGSRSDLRLWDVSTGSLIVSVRGPDLPATLLGFANDGHAIIAGFSNGTVYVWDSITGQQTGQFTAYVP